MYCKTDFAVNYSKVTNIREYKKEIVTEKMGVFTLDFIRSGKLFQARLRPYNAEEMKALIGKVVENINFAHFITTFDKELQEVVSGSDGYSAKDLVEFGYTIDGQPCGVLEHIEDGEWVE